MQLVCIAALLLSAVAAQPDSWRPWQDEKFPPAGGSQLDADSKHGDNEQSMTKAFDVGDRPERTSNRPVWVPNFMSAESGVPLPELSKLVRRHGRGKKPKRKHPHAKVFSPVFKVDNMTLQNVTDITLKEGENLFLMLKHGGRAPHHHQGGRHRPPKNEFQQYVKLFYNTTQPNEVSIEFGVVKPVNFGHSFGGEYNPDEDF